MGGVFAALGLALTITACAAQRQGTDGRLSDQTVEGFAELISAANEGEYQTCRGEEVHSSWREYDDGEQAVEWRTAPVPEACEAGRTVFTWSCAMTARLSSASDLIRLGEPEGTAALTELMLQGSVEARRVAAADLALAQESATVPALIEALDDDDAQVQLAAVGALGRIGDPSSAPGLTRLFQDGDGAVRTTAVTAQNG